MEEITSLIRVQDIDHSGIVAGIIDQMGLVELLNQEIGTHKQEIISAGVAVKAMIFKGLALVLTSIYLFERFFVGKATSHLLGEGECGLKRWFLFKRTMVTFTISYNEDL